MEKVRKGKRIKQINAIRVYETYSDSRWVHTCVCPDNTVKLFSGYTKEQSKQRAFNWATSNTDYTKRGVYQRGKDKGLAVLVCLNYNDLVYLLTVIPKRRGNRILIGKLEDALRRSYEKREGPG